MLWQPSLPDRYTRADAAELATSIARRRHELGQSLVILGHHYQADEVIQHADFTGDSLKLSQTAAQVAQERPVKWLVFCGVHFMAETADMLTPEHVRVILPDLSAGCSMADMAAYDDAIAAWDEIHDSLRESVRVVPITYVNSSAAIKAFVGERGGACCTSSNAESVMRWALAGGTEPVQPGEDIKVLFLPDQHLGRNTAARLLAPRGASMRGIDVLYDPRRARKGEPLAGIPRDDLLRARVILWAGHCSVHKLFRPEHCAEVRARSAAEPGRPAIKILVHPECSKEVVDLADLNGSTEFIIRTLRDAEPGTRWAVGTEVHLVNRLAREAAARGVEVRILSDCQCLCTTMYRIDQAHLLWVLDHLTGAFSKDGSPKVVNEIRVHPLVREKALLAVDRMLELARPAAAVGVD